MGDEHPNNLESADYVAFLLRFWREDAELPWRVTAVNPHTGEKLTFAAPEQFWTYLQQKLASPGS